MDKLEWHSARVCNLLWLSATYRLWAPLLGAWDRGPTSSQPKYLIEELANIIIGVNK